MLEINNLHFEYFDRPVLQNVTFQVNPYQILHIKGANGKGKSTLLKCMIGLLSPTNGYISFQGENVSKDIVSFQKQLCYLGHKLSINLSLSPRENIQFNFLQDISVREQQDALYSMSLESVAEMPCFQLSMGQKKRTSLLRLHFSTAPIWLLDEPFVGLDEDTVIRVSQLILAHAARSGMVLLTSHTDLPFKSECFREYTL